MTTEIRVPTLGKSVSEATIGRWFKKTGDAVKADEPLLELETDKVTLEVNAPASGVLAEIAATDGETVGVGALLGADQQWRRGAGAGEGRRQGRSSKPSARRGRGACARSESRRSGIRPTRHGAVASSRQNRR